MKRLRGGDVYAKSTFGGVRFLLTVWGLVGEVCVSFPCSKAVSFTLLLFLVDVDPADECRRF